MKILINVYYQRKKWKNLLKPDMIFWSHLRELETKARLQFTSKHREFELSIIFRFLSYKDKLLKMALVKKSWNSLISKHYTWSRFPKRCPHFLITEFVNFMNRFSELTGIDVTGFHKSSWQANRLSASKEHNLSASQVSLHGKDFHLCLNIQYIYQS